MQPSRPKSLVLIAALQFITVVLLPPRMLAGIGPAVGIAVVVLFGVLGLSMLRLRPWARVAAIFVQGMNIIVRLLVLLGNVVAPEGGVDYALLGTFVLAAALSALILVEIDKPEIQMIMQ